MKKETKQLDSIKAIIFDIDGVLWINEEANPHSAPLLSKLRTNHKLPFRLLTNDCTTTRSTRQKKLSAGGIFVNIDEIFTALTLTHMWLHKHNISKIMYLGTDIVRYSFKEEGFLESTSPEVVVIGDLFDSYNRNSIEQAVEHIQRGATLLAMQRNRTWYDGVRVRVDNGFWVSAFEYTTGVEAITIGKPSAFSYLATCSDMGINIGFQSVLIVSDDYKSDLKGAKAKGLTTALLSANPPSPLPWWIDLTFHDLEEFVNILQIG